MCVGIKKELLNSLAVAQNEFCFLVIYVGSVMWMSNEREVTNRKTVVFFERRESQSPLNVCAQHDKFMNFISVFSVCVMLQIPYDLEWPKRKNVPTAFRQ